MAKETVGYVHLEWTCPNCNTRNPGPQKLCSGCGAAQPAGVQFEQAAQEALLTDQAAIEKAKAGPDVHCKFCGARNPAEAATCSRCGADLGEGAARERGRVLGAHRDRPAEMIPCRACGTPNDPSAQHCKNCGASLGREEPKPAQPAAPLAAARKGISPVLLGLLGLACIAALVIFFVLFNRTEGVVGSVREVVWTRTISIEALRPATHEDWRDEIPAGAEVGTCREAFHHVESEPVPGAEKICGTPYTVDLGSGSGEVVQDCEYRVYGDLCQYTLDEWQQVDAVTLSGDDLFPEWPTFTLAADERAGQRGEEYGVTIATDEGVYSYEPRDAADYARFEVGSRWTLEINTFNQLMSLAPAD